MAKEYSRSRRVADQIQRHMAEIIQLELGDPRVGMVTVTGVDITREFERARIYFSIFGNQDEVETTSKVLNQAAGYLRTVLAKRMKLRTTPQLVFIYDESLEKGNRMDSLIKSAMSDTNIDSDSDSDNDNDNDSKTGGE